MKGIQRKRAPSDAAMHRNTLGMCTIVLAAGVAVGMPAQAAMFLKLSGIEGESTSERHAGEIDISGIEQSILAPPTPSGASGKGKANCPTVSLYKNLDKSTPTLMKYLASGKHIPQAVLTVARSGESQADYYIITMQEVFVTEVTQSSTDTSQLIDKIVLAPRTFSVEYKLQNPRGDQSSVKFGWNCVTTEIT